MIEYLKEYQLKGGFLQELTWEEWEFEGRLRKSTGRFESALVRGRSKLEELLSEHSDNEKMVQEIEEAIALMKQSKAIATEEQMVSAWNKYILFRKEV